MRADYRSSRWIREHALECARVMAVLRKHRGYMTSKTVAASLLHDEGYDYSGSSVTRTLQ